MVKKSMVDLATASVGVATAAVVGRLPLLVLVLVVLMADVAEAKKAQHTRRKGKTMPVIR